VSRKFIDTIWTSLWSSWCLHVRVGIQEKTKKNLDSRLHGNDENE
jgi:hypothetical protein